MMKIVIMVIIINVINARDVENINKYYIDKQQSGKSDLWSAYVTKNLGTSQVHCKHPQWQV